MSAPVRTDGWEERLAAVVEEWRNAPFAWGSRDCALWANDVVFALTGVDHAERLLLTYNDAHGANSVLERLGGLERVFQQCGLERVRIAYAQRGDLVLFEGGLGLTAGAFLGPYIASPGKNGLVFSSREDVTQHAVSAWRVGYA